MTATSLLLISIAATLAIWGVAMTRMRSASIITVIAVLAAVASVGRVLLAGLPGLEPVSAIVVVATIVLGLRVGMAVGVATVVVSNSVLGHGPWTFWQAMGFALVALIAWALWKAVMSMDHPARHLRLLLASITAVGVLAYDLLLIASQPLVLGLERLTLAAWTDYLWLGLPLTMMHIAGAAAVAAALGPDLMAALWRVRVRLDSTVEPASTTASSAAPARG